jgi:hypothetical protein
MERRGPRTTDVQRAKAAYHKASRSLGAYPTPAELKAASKLAKAAFRLQREAWLREEARKKPRDRSPLFAYWR